MDDESIVFVGKCFVRLIDIVGNILAHACTGPHPAGAVLPTGLLRVVMWPALRAGTRKAGALRLGMKSKAGCSFAPWCTAMSLTNHTFSRRYRWCRGKRPVGSTLTLWNVRATSIPCRGLSFLAKKETKTPGPKKLAALRQFLASSLLPRIA